MKKFIIVIFIISITSGCNNALSEYLDSNSEQEWFGIFTNERCFNFNVRLKEVRTNQYNLILSNGNEVINEVFNSDAQNRIRFRMDDQLAFDFEEHGEKLSGFIKSGRLLYRTALNEIAPGEYVGQWNPYMFNDGMITNTLRLYIGVESGTRLVAYPFLGDRRSRGPWVNGFQKKGKFLHFQDNNTGFEFRVTKRKNKVKVAIYVSNALISESTLFRSEEQSPLSRDIAPPNGIQIPIDLNDGWEIGKVDEHALGTHHLMRLIDSVKSYRLVNTNGIVIAKQGKLIFESYFNGFNSEIPHDLRSASKSISSAIIGIALDDNIIKSVDENLNDFLSVEILDTADPKGHVSLKNLLTMSSGLDVNNLASEGYYQDSRNPDSWLETVMKSPVVHNPGTYSDYGSANPFLLGVCLNERLSTSMDIYIHEKLFEPLGITNYILQTDDTQVTPYFGGGWFLTPRDMLKFGQLFLDNGVWKGSQLISQDWVQESTGKHVRLQDVSDKNEYGYQWWHDRYEVNDQIIQTIEARGAGGQFIFIIPQLEVVVAITSGNFRNGLGNQPRTILQDYILPAMINE